MMTRDEFFTLCNDVPDWDKSGDFPHISPMSYETGSNKEGWK